MLKWRGMLGKGLGALKRRAVAPYEFCSIEQRSQVKVLFHLPRKEQRRTSLFSSFYWQFSFSDILSSARSCMNCFSWWGWERGSPVQSN